MENSWDWDPTDSNAAMEAHEERLKLRVDLAAAESRAKASEERLERAVKLLSLEHIHETKAQLAACGRDTCRFLTSLVPDILKSVEARESFNKAAYAYFDSETNGDPKALEPEGQKETRKKFVAAWDAFVALAARSENLDMKEPRA